MTRQPADFLKAHHSSALSLLLPDSLDFSGLTAGGGHAHRTASLLPSADISSGDGAASLTAPAWLLPAADVPQHSIGHFQASHTGGSTQTTSGVGSTSTIPGVQYHWDGITFAQSGGYYPPDNALAVGTNVAITAENDAIQFTTRTGSGAVTESLSTFFASVMSSGYFLSDPKLIFDAANHRFILSVDEISNALTSSKVLLAVSGSDFTTPSLSSSASNWHFQAINTSYQVNGQATWSDQPLLSVDGHNIFVSTNQFTSAGNYVASAVTVLDDGLYSTSGGSHLISALAYANPSYQPAAISGGGAYFASYVGNALSIFESNGTTNTSPVLVQLGNIDHGSGGYAAAQKGTTFQLDAGDGRITSAAYDSAHQKLYVVFEVLPTSSATIPSVEWVQLDMSAFNSSGGTTAPSVLHSGNLNALLPASGATYHAATFNASVAVDGNGDALINFNASGPNMYAADYYTVWKGAGGATSTTAPAFSAPIDYHDSVAAYIDPGHDAVGRWGDYSTATMDFTALNGFYISNEFDNGTVSHYSSWGTAVADVVV